MNITVTQPQAFLGLLDIAIKQDGITAAREVYNASLPVPAPEPTPKPVE